MPEAIVQPPGLPLLDAAGWVGGACWSELRWHEVLTAWIRSGADPLLAAQWWTLRADAAGRAEAWHRRLPELREFPRSGFVTAPPSDLPATLDGAERATDDREERATAVLHALVSRYRGHQSVAVGCADGPVARTLADALASMDRTTSAPAAP